MPERIEKYYICSCCGSESSDPKFIQEVWVPARNYESDGERFTPGMAKVDLCATCFKVFWELSDGNFATFEASEFGVDVFPHFETGGDSDS